MIFQPSSPESLHSRDDTRFVTCSHHFLSLSSHCPFVEKKVPLLRTIQEVFTDSVKWASTSTRPIEPQMFSWSFLRGSLNFPNLPNQKFSRKPCFFKFVASKQFGEVRAYQYCPLVRGLTRTSFYMLGVRFLIVDDVTWKPQIVKRCGCP